MQEILKKTGVLLVTLLLVALFAFLAFEIIPGDPTTMLLGSEYTPERAEAMRKAMGLDRNVLLRFFDWLSAFMRGDMGTSYSYAMPVREVLRGKISVTAILSVMSWILVTAFSIPSGRCPGALSVKALRENRHPPQSGADGDSLLFPWYSADLFFRADAEALYPRQIHPLSGKSLGLSRLPVLPCSRHLHPEDCQDGEAPARLHPQ
jgi:hypothetical protein